LGIGLSGDPTNDEIDIGGVLNGQVMGAPALITFLILGVLFDGL